MKEFYVEFINKDGKSCWTFCKGDREEDVKYTLSIYGSVATHISEIHPEKL